VHDAWWSKVRAGQGEAEGTRALVEVLLLHRSMAHEHVVAGIAAALQAGALTADAVAVEARKAAQADHQDQADASGSTVRQAPADPGLGQVASLTQRRLAALPLPPDTRPLPSVAAYDQLLRRPPRAPAARPTSHSQGDLP
jgi:hypothetical protein